MTRTKTPTKMVKLQYACDAQFTSNCPLSFHWPDENRRQYPLQKNLITH